ncbi:unnamed protein product [Rhizophagus irregularis]|nr:unnamed protein product [Rhizophagus irregularis]
MQSELRVVKLLAENDEIKAENAELRQTMEKNDARLAKLEQSDKEKATFGLRTPGIRFWVKGNAGRNFTKTMLKDFGISFWQYGVSTFGWVTFQISALALTRWIDISFDSFDSLALDIGFDSFDSLALDIGFDSFDSLALDIGFDSFNSLALGRYRLRFFRFFGFGFWFLDVGISASLDRMNFETLKNINLKHDRHEISVTSSLDL